MRYFSDVFTKETWAAFLAGDRAVTAFSAGMERRALEVAHGDRLICYLRREFAFVGALEVTSTMYRSEGPIWGGDGFPVRMNVAPRVVLPRERGLPLASFEGKLAIYPPGVPVSTVPVHFQGSPRAMRDGDGDVVWRALMAADDGVTDVGLNAPSESTESRGDEHYEMQAILAALGTKMGCQVWVPANDRARVQRRPEAPASATFATRLPAVFGGLSARTVEQIDVIWLDGHEVVAAFEVEHSTQIYSGLLRMADLVALLPNLRIDLFVVADEARLARWRAELNRPTFERLGLTAKCHFLPYAKVRDIATLGHAVLTNLRRDYFRDVSTPLQQ